MNLIESENAEGIRLIKSISRFLSPLMVPNRVFFEMQKVGFILIQCALDKAKFVLELIWVATLL